MLYDKYTQKMQRVKDALNFIKRHRVVITIAFALVLVATTVLMSFKGTIHVSAEAPSEVVYGEPIKPFASAFLSDVKYQYYDNGWSNQMPAKTGEYKIRAVAKKAFGSSYSDEYKITILKREVDVSIEEKTVYGENPILQADLAYKDKITCDNFSFDYGETIKATPIMSAIKIINSKGINVTDNYILNIISGPLSYIPRDLEVSFSGKTKVYDGTPLIADKFTSSGLASGDSIDIYGASSITQAGEVDAKGKVHIYNQSGNLINTLYNIKVTSGKLKIEKRSISVHFSSAQKVYDGEDLISENFTSEGSLAAGDTINTTALSKLNEVGEIENILNVYVYNLSGTNVTDSYQIATTTGTLSITKRNVTIETPSQTFEYEDRAFSTSYFNIKSGSLAPDSNIEPQNPTQITEVGKKINECTLKIIDRRGKDATKNYNITYDFGTLTVVKRDILVTTGSKELVYNGTDQSFTELSVDNPVYSHGAKADGTLTTVKNVGDRKQNKFSVKITDKNNVDKTANYNITYQYGIIEVVPISITVVTASAQFAFDGKPHSDSTFTITNGKLLSGDSAVAVAPFKSITSPNEVVDNIFRVDIKRSGKIVNECYDITYEYGTLSMLPIPIKITTATNSWVYDGNEHYDETFTVSSGLLSGHTLKISETFKIKNVGTSYNMNTYEVYYTNVNVTENYNITYDYGSLTITKRDLFVETATNSWAYDDEYHHNERISYSNLVAGHALTAQPSTAVRDVSEGKVDNYVSLIIVDQEGNYVEDNYNFKFTLGQLWITPIKVTLKPHDEEKPYDGYPLYAKDFSVAAGKVYGKVSVLASYDGSITEIGSITSTMSNARIYLNRDVTKNYEITYSSGTLTVTKRSLSVIAASADKFYDGQPLTSDDYYCGHDGLLRGHMLTAKTEGSQIEVGVSWNSIVAGSVKITSGGKNVMEYYSYWLVSGTLHVWTREIHIFTGSAEKDYDGTPLKYEYYELSGELVDNHEYRVAMYAQRTAPGTTVNSPTISIYENGIDITVSYKIYKTLGLLTVFGSVDGDDGEHGYGDKIGGGLGGGGLIGGGSGGGSGGGGDGGDDGDDDKEPIEIFNALANIGGDVYFRQKSFGSYEFNSWQEAVPYQNSENENPFYLSAQSLMQSLGHKSTVYIQPILPAINFLAPYYLYETVQAKAQSNDVGAISLESNAYYAAFLSYMFNEADFENGKFTSPSPYFEQAYYEFILGQYLHLPQSTRSEMLAIADSYGLKSGQKGLIQRVIDIVQNKVEYNRKHEKYIGDNAVYFFKEAKTGICSHYATAATVLLRALGIPARYTVGYYANLKADVLTPVDSDQAHAWVEVYFKGVGWIQIEVTGGRQNDDEEPEIIKPILRIKPIDVTKMYDGTPLFAENKITGADYFSNLIIEELSAIDCRYSVTVAGSRTDFGVSASTILDFTLYDKNANKINDNFEIEFHDGRIRITNKPIYIHLYEKQKFYDGTPLSYNPNDYWTQGLPEGYKLTFNLVGSLTNVGELSVEQLESLPFTVHDDNGKDVTNTYSLVFEGRTLRIDRQNIEISSGSATKTFDGDPLTDDTFWLSMGKLAENETITAILDKSITQKGSAPNTFKQIKILDPEGNDTTINYKITLIYGTLTIT